MKIEIRNQNNPEKKPFDRCEETYTNNKSFEGNYFTLEITQLDQLLKLSKRCDLLIKSKGDFNIPLIILLNN